MYLPYPNSYKTSKWDFKSIIAKVKKRHAPSWCAFFFLIFFSFEFIGLSRLFAFSPQVYLLTFFLFYCIIKVSSLLTIYCISFLVRSLLRYGDLTFCLQSSCKVLYFLFWFLTFKYPSCFQKSFYAFRFSSVNRSLTCL